MKRRVIQRSELLEAMAPLLELLEADPDTVHSLTIRPTHLLLHTVTDRDLTERIDLVGPPTVGS